MRFTESTGAIALACLLALLVLGCSTGENVVAPEPAQGPLVGAYNPRVSLGNWVITLDEAAGVEIAPLRNGTHLNVIGFLEKWPCTDCLRVTGFDWQPGYVDVTVTMKHPFPGLPNFTGFDVRGICFLPGTFVLPGLTQTMPDFRTENYIQPSPLSYSGYTELFNPVTSPDGLPNGYEQGKMTPWPRELLTGSLGAFNYFATYPIGTVRNVFETWDVISTGYRIMRVAAGPIIFGYSVDASWAPPDSTPIIVPDSFPLAANCLEAWQILLQVDDSELKDDGGNLYVTAIAYDHQGVDTLGGAIIECPDLCPSTIEGDLIWEDEPSQCSAYEFTVPNIELTAASFDEVQFVVMVYPLEDIDLYAFNTSTATVYPGGISDCPAGVHETFLGQGEFMQFGNFTIPPADAAIMTSGDNAGEFLMCGNGFAGSMLGGYDISDLGPNEPNGFIGLIGLGAPTSLDVSPNNDNIFIVMQMVDENDDIQVWSFDATKGQTITSPNGGSINSVDVTPAEELWFIELAETTYYLHHAVPVSEWTWEIVGDDSISLFTGLPATTHVFDLIYEPISQRIYIYHEYMNGTVTVYDASETGPPVEMPDITFEAIWGYSGPLLYFDGGYFFHGADIELDLVEGEFSNCRIVVFGNFELSDTSVMKFDQDLNVLDAGKLTNGPFSTFAISVDPESTGRRLVFLPYGEFNDDYYLFDPPVDW